MTQVLPASDAFASGVVPYCDFIAKYLRLRVSTAGADATTGFGITFTLGSLGSLHASLRSISTQVFSEIAPGPAAITVNNPTGAPTGQMFREEIAGDVRAQIVFHIAAIGGLVNPNGYFKYAWVGARINATTQVGTAPTQSHENGRGYWFALNSAGSANTAKWQLIRRDNTGNLLTVLAQSAAPFSLGTLQISGPRMMRIEVTDVGADVRIRCFTAASLPSGGIPPGNPAEVEIFDFTDSSASKITAAGRCGFVSSLELTVGVVKHVQLIDSFRIDVGAALYMLDEFARVKSDMLATVTGAFGISGADLGCDWAGGVGSALGLKAFRSTSGTWTNRLHFIGSTPLGTTASETIGGYLLSVRASPDAKSQHRSVVLVFESTGSAPTHRAVGIFVRASGGGEATAPASGYLCEVSLTGAAVATLKVYRLQGANQVLIAQVTGTISCTQDAEHTLDFEVHNLAGASGQPDTAAVMTAKWDTVQQTLVSVHLGVIANAGIIYDKSTQRVLSGLGEGIRVYLPDGTRKTYVDTWAQQTLVNPGQTPNQDQASIAFLSETFNHSGQTLTFPLAWGVREERPRVVDKYRYEDGHKYRRSRYGRLRRVWSVHALALSDAQRNTLRTNWRDHNGCEKAFSWKPPIETAAVKVHFQDDTLAHVLAAPITSNFDFGIEELFDS